MLFGGIYLKILFKNETKYNKEIYENFLNFHNKKFHFKYTLYTAAIIMLLIFCLSLQVKYHNYTLAILFGIFLSAFFLWRFLHPFSTVQKELKSKKIENEKVFNFIFYEDKIKIRDNQNYNVISYYKLYKIFETENFFYLYIDKTHSFVLNKHGFLIGNSNDFSTFIKKKCKLKYHKEQYS